MSEGKIEYVWADWKDISGLAIGFCNAIEEFGLYIIEDPLTEGSDTFGFIISDKPIDIEKERNRYNEE